MEPIGFKPLNIGKRPQPSAYVPSIFYRAMIEKQDERNGKIARFEQELQDRNRRELSMLQMRNEKQQYAVKQFEEEADRDRAWESFVNGLHRLSVAPGGSDSLRRFVETELLPTLRGGLADKDTKYRRSKCEALVQAIVGGRVAATIAEMNQIISDMGKCSAVTCSAEPLTQLVHALDALHTELGAAVRAPSATLDDLLAQRDTLALMLQRPLIKQLESSGREAAQTVCAAQDKLNELTQRMAEEQTKAAAQRQEKPPLPQPAARTQESIATAKSASVGSSGATGAWQALITHLPYLTTDTSNAAWLQEIRQNVVTLSLPDVLEQALAQAVDHISYAYLRASNGGAGGEEDMMSENAAAPVDSANANASGVSLAQVNSVLAELESLLHAVVKGGSQAFLRVLIALFDAVLREVQDNPEVKSEEDLLLYAVLVCGMFRALSAKMHTQSAKIFHALLLSQSAHAVPNLLVSAGCKVSGAAVKLGTKVCLLYAALVGHAVSRPPGESSSMQAADPKPPASPLTAAQGWEWLQRAATQLHLLISLHQSKSPSPAQKALVDQLAISENTIATACRTVRTFLRLAGHGLYLSYQTKFSELLGTIKKTIQSVAATVADAGNLGAMIDAALGAKYIVPAYYRGQAPFMLDGASLTRYVDREREAVLAAEQNKQSPFMQRVKALQIDRLRVIFNKLSVTAESQATAVKSLLEKIVLSNAESPEFLRYTLYKIAFNLSADCQEEFFNEMDEGHPLKLARVACGLSTSIPELGELIRAQFYKLCPLTIPKAAELGLSGQEFLADMGFKQKPGGAWEDKSQWLARMSKMLCTYCVVMIQPEQQPLSLADAWAWLANIVNISTPRPAPADGSKGATGPKPPFFTATALEVMLRVTAQDLHTTYGESFLALLRIVNDVIVPNLAQDAPRHEELKTFLRVFLSSNGREFMSLFNKPVTTC